MGCSFVTVSSVVLAPVHYVILGCLAVDGPQTSYSLKKSTERIAGWMWTFPHAQLYTEPPKLVEAGFAEVEVEEGGRRRRTYAITDAGIDELGRWAGAPSPKDPEIRDLAFLKLFFAHTTSPKRVRDLALQQVALHQRRIDWVERLIEGSVSDPGARYRRAAGRLGLAHSRLLRDFWLDVADDPRRERDRE